MPRITMKTSDGCITMKTSNGPVEATLIVFGSKSGTIAGKVLSNLYDCRVPAEPVLNAWLGDRLFSEEETDMLKSVLLKKPDAAEWSSAEGAYSTYRLAKTIFGDPSNNIAVLRHFLAGGKYTTPEYVAKHQVECGLTPHMVKQLTNPKNSHMAAGKCAKFILRRWKQHLGERPSLADQLKIWRPIHDAKFSDLNPKLKHTFEKLRHMDPAPVLVERSFTLVHAKQSTWDKSPYGGGVRTATNSLPEHTGEAYGHNWMGTILSACAHRLLNVPIQPWDPVERYKTRDEIKRMKEQNNNGTVTVTGGKRKATKEKAPKAKAPNPKTPNPKTPKAKAPKAKAPKAKAPNPKTPKAKAPKAEAVVVATIPEATAVATPIPEATALGTYDCIQHVSDLVANMCPKEEEELVTTLSRIRKEIVGPITSFLMDDFNENHQETRRELASWLNCGAILQKTVIEQLNRMDNN